jgi:hypothetical protein
MCEFSRNQYRNKNRIAHLFPFPLRMCLGRFAELPERSARDSQVCTTENRS